MSSTFGELFKVSTFGESHGVAVGAIVDGVPGGIELTEAELQVQLDRRRPGQSEVSTPRDEADQVRILSGVENGKTLGTPIALVVNNKTQRPGDYGEMSKIPRPSHADYTYQMKYGNRAASGGGRASARETIGRVAAGAIAEKLLREKYGIEIVAYVSAVGTLDMGDEAWRTDVTREMVDTNVMRCPDQDLAENMRELVLQAKADHDSVGGVVTCVCKNVPIGLGEPIFDKLDAVLAHAMLSLPACKGFEIGSGFKGATMRGSQHNDSYVKKGDALGTATNFSGGVQGGISNGEPIVFRLAFKPVATIGIEQKTSDFDGNETVLAAKGRHDPCVVARAVPVVETMAALVLADMDLRQAYREKK